MVVPDAEANCATRRILISDAYWFFGFTKVIVVSLLIVHSLMSTFILASSSAELPSSSDLQLLPFSLSPTPTHAPIGKYFRPRPAPAGLGVVEGQQVAAFRGRQIVGQRIDVPRGYKGIVLRAFGGPNESRSTGIKVPLTPAASYASSSTGTVSEAAEPEMRATRSRARGSGQVALSRPRRAVASRGVKRIKLDDSDDDDDGDVAAPLRREVRPKIELEVPEIHVLPPTQVAEEETQESALPESLTETEETQSTETELSAPLALPPTPPAYEEEAHLEKQPAYIIQTAIEEGTAARVLVPTASFNAFTLWTPDTALAGFDQDELEKKAVGVDITKPESDESAVTSRLHSGWWRKGGAGEGGDEFVRALGEWIGLGELVSEKPAFADY